MNKILDLYSSKIKPQARELERTRNNLLTSLAAADLIGGFIFYKFQGMFPPAFTFMWPVLAILAFTINYFIYQGFVRTFKSKIMHDLVEALIPGASYNPTGHIPQGDFTASQIETRSCNRFKGEDLVEGKIGNILVQFSEIEASHVETTIQKGRPKEKKSILYKGLFFTFSLPISLNQNTLILDDKAEALLGKNITQFFQKRMAPTGYSLVQLESLEFEKKFAVYSKDQIKSRVLLTPATMKKLYAFISKFKSPTEISFQDDKIYVALKHNKDLFEPRLFGPIVSMNDLNEIYKIIHFVENFHINIDLISKVA